MTREEAAKARVHMAYETLQRRAPGEKLYVAYSGGKDSECIVQICREAVGMGALEIAYNAPGIDPPEIVRHVKQQFCRWRDEGAECNFDNAHLKAGITMHNLIIKKGPPTRQKRYCCEYFKEHGGDGRVAITGVRWAESNKRSKNHGSITLYSKRKKERFSYYDDPYEQMTIFMGDNHERRRGTEICSLAKGRITHNPIIDWPDRLVWAYAEEKGLILCDAYRKYGLSRLGCIGCPMANKSRYREFAIWPHMYRYYLNAFAGYIAEHPEAAARYGWDTPANMMHWYLEDGYNPDQMVMEL